MAGGVRAPAMDEGGRVETARQAAQQAGEIAMDLFRQRLAVETKRDKTDVVTRADREAQTAAVEAISAGHPGETVVGEEGDGTEAIPEEGPAWIIDPIDGTSNFVRGVRVWATSVAAVIDGEPVAAVNYFPALGDTYVAGQSGATRNGESISVSDRTDPETFVVSPTIWWDFHRREEYARAARAVVTRFGDLSRLRCAQATLSQIAAGGLDAAFTNIDPNPWDTVAGVYLIRQAGGTVTDLAGDRWTHASTGLVASNGCCHDEVVAAAREIEDR
jgi:myo-inositol-1(or 4)-monophosphatase